MHPLTRRNIELRPFDTFGQLFDHFFAPSAGDRMFVSSGTDDTRREPTWRPTVDISETDSAYIIRADLPETRKEDVTLNFAEGVLSLRGQRKRATEHKDEKFHRIERVSGTFERRFLLPEDADNAAITAAFENGVLTVTAPRKAPQPPPQRTIPIN